jgi:hypothetical protein
MADPLSTVGVVLALLQIVTAVGEKVVSTQSDMKRIPREMEDLMNS